jgi:hypothetical protein
LKALANIKSARISGNVFDWAVDVAYQLSADGSVTLGALLKTLSSSQARRWYLDTQPEPVQLVELIEMLRWALRFPQVFSISDGPNRCDLFENIKKRCTVWLELRSEHFEKIERSIVISLIETALDDSLRRFYASPSPPKDPPTIVHIFPSMRGASGIADWIKESSLWAKHIAVHSLDDTKPLEGGPLEWARFSRQIWIVGGMKPLQYDQHKIWLNEEEIKKVNNLADGFLFVRNQLDRRHMILNAACGPLPKNEASRFRHQTAKQMKTSIVRQYSTATWVADDALGETQLLYQQICSVDALRNGWFRLSARNRKTHGVDNITYEMYENNLENELRKLANELSARTYRCMPLRRINIPKADGGIRPLSIPCIRDRVVQSTCLILLDHLVLGTAIDAARIMRSP